MFLAHAPRPPGSASPSFEYKPIPRSKPSAFLSGKEEHYEVKWFLVGFAEFGSAGILRSRTALFASFSGKRRPPLDGVVVSIEFERKEVKRLILCFAENRVNHSGVFVAVLWQHFGLLQRNQFVL
jgi:hypothetical protein